jgi:hypothetical protein
MQPNPFFTIVSYSKSETTMTCNAAPPTVAERWRDRRCKIAVATAATNYWGNRNYDKHSRNNLKMTGLRFMDEQL